MRRNILKLNGVHVPVAVCTRMQPHTPDGCRCRYCTAVRTKSLTQLFHSFSHGATAVVAVFERTTYEAVCSSARMCTNMPPPRSSLDLGARSSPGRTRSPDQSRFARTYARHPSFSGTKPVSYGTSSRRVRNGECIFIRLLLAACCAQ